jgi:hypothetical protein
VPACEALPQALAVVLEEAVAHSDASASLLLLPLGLPLAQWLLLAGALGVTAALSDAKALEEAQTLTAALALALWLREPTPDAEGLPLPDTLRVASEDTDSVAELHSVSVAEGVGEGGAEALRGGLALALCVVEAECEGLPDALPVALA